MVKKEITPANILEHLNTPLVLHKNGSKVDFEGYIIKNITRYTESTPFYFIIMHDKYAGWAARLESAVKRSLEAVPDIGSKVLPNIDDYTAWHIDNSRGANAYYAKDLGVWNFSTDGITISVYEKEKDKVLNKKYRWRKKR